MVGFTRMYLNQLQSALDDGLETVEAAAKVGHQRAQMLGEILAVHVLYEMAEHAKARRHNARVLDYSRRLGASRFEAQALLYEGRLDQAEGRGDEALKTLERALEMSAEVGHGFTGPRIVGEIARTLIGAEAKCAALAEGERMLEGGSVSHNHLFFYRDAIEVSFDISDWNGVERYAAALENFTRHEPLPWGDFYISRARALATWRQGRREPRVMAEIERLCDEAERINFAIALPALKEAPNST
jgi:tetratricopeptide (TPR) repeat protein